MKFKIGIFLVMLFQGAVAITSPSVEADSASASSVVEVSQSQKEFEDFIKERYGAKGLDVKICRAFRDIFPRTHVAVSEVVSAVEQVHDAHLAQYGCSINRASLFFNVLLGLGVAKESVGDVCRRVSFSKRECVKSMWNEFEGAHWMRLGECDECSPF